MQDARAHVRGGNSSHDVCRTLESSPLVMHEEEGFVLPDRAADASAEAIVLKLGIFLAKAVSRPGVGVQVVVLQVLVRCAMEGIAAPPRHHLHFTASRARESRCGVVRDDAKLLQAFDWCWHNRARRGREVGAAILTAAGGAVCRIAAIQ